MTSIPVCAHIAISPFMHDHRRFDSIGQAKEHLRNFVRDFIGPYNPDYPVIMDLYQMCDDCTWQMNFHDYPMSRYVVGPQNGIKKVAI